MSSKQALWLTFSTIVFVGLVVAFPTILTFSGLQSSTSSVADLNTSSGSKPESQNVQSEDNFTAQDISPEQKPTTDSEPNDQTSVDANDSSQPNDTGEKPLEDNSVIMPGARGDYDTMKDAYSRDII